MPTHRLIWLDCLRLIAGLSMVLLHSTADSNGQAWPAYDVAERIAPLLLRAVVYIARTELFLIISVFLLLLALERRPRTYQETIREQARRLLLPFAFWTAFFAFYNLIKADAFNYHEHALEQISSPQVWLRFLLLGDVKYHMHFLPTLFGLLLFFPLFRLAVRNPILGVTVFACLFLKRELDAALYQRFWGTDALPYLVRAAKIMTYVGYGMFAGAMLGVWQKIPTAARSRAFTWIAFFGGALFLLKLSETWKVITLGHWIFDSPSGFWADFLMPVVLFAGCLVLGHKNWPAFLSRVAPFSFGIYLCHPIFLDLCEIALRGTQWPPFVQVLLKISVSLVATSTFVVLLSRSHFWAWTIGLGPLPFSAGGQHFVKRAR